MSLSNREQLVAFIALIVAILALGLAPVVTAGIMGKTLPDSLIAVSDKTVTGLVTLAAMIFRTNRADQTATENTGKAFEAIAAAASSTPATNEAGNAADQVADAAQTEADKIKGA